MSRTTKPAAKPSPNTTLNDLAKTDIKAAEAFAEKHAGELAMNTYINATLEQLEQTRAYRKYLNSPDGAAEMSKDEREREILKLRFGLDRGEPRTLEEVGEHFNLTRERIRQIEARAMSKLRHPSSDTGARDLLAV